MRICLLNQFYPPDTAATGQLLADVAEALASRGHQVHVICSRQAYDGGNVTDAPTPSGVCLHRVAATGFGRGNLLGRGIDYASFYMLALRDVLALPPMDVCVSLTTPPFIGVVAAALKRRRKTRLVLWSMDLYPEVAVALAVLSAGSTIHRFLAAVARRLYGAADAIVSLGDVMTQRLISAGASADRIVTAANWVPGEVVSPIAPRDSAARQQWSPDRRTTVMYSGNLGMGHELDTALKAVAQVEDRSDLRVLLVGRGAMRERLQRLASELNLENVVFHPPQPLAKLADTLAAGDVHLVAQRPGTQGLIVSSKLYGIMAAGRAVLYVGPDDTEVAETIRRADCGLIAPPGDAPAVADALRALIGDAGRRADMGRRGREYYESHLGRDRSVGRIVEVIERQAGAG